MQATGRVNWSQALRRRNGAPPLPPTVEIS